MPLFPNPYANFLVETLLAEFIVTILGVIFAQTIMRGVNNRRFGRWRLTVLKNNNKVIEDVPISANKMKQISETPEDMPVFLKGLCSPFHHIQCDLMRKGVEKGVLKIDKRKRHIIIDLDKDQPEDIPTSLNHNL